MSSRIHLHEAALWDTSGAELAFNEAGPGTALGTGTGTFKAQALALDEWALKEGIERVDYIKLDVEGAEGRVLNGARQVIEQHQPNLAVALYHSLADFTELPRLVDEIAPGYRFHLGHYTIHQEETILFATR